MAKSFGSGAEIKSYIIAQMKPAVKEVQEKVYDVCTKFLNVFYGEYEPQVSIRTYQLFNSLVKTDVRKSGNGWTADVYFDIGALSHPTSYTGQDGRLVQKKWSEDKIMTTALKTGTHGGTWTGVGGIAIWDESLGVISPQAIQWIKQELIAAGIPVH